MRTEKLIVIVVIIIVVFVIIVNRIYHSPSVFVILAISLTTTKITTINNEK